MLDNDAIHDTLDDGGVDTPDTQSASDLEQPSAATDTTTRKPKSTTVRLYPVPGAHVYPYPAEVIDVSRKEAETLLAYEPPAYRTSPNLPRDLGPNASNPPGKEDES